MFPCRSLKLTLPPSEMASTYLHNCRRPHSPIKFVKEISMQCTQHLNRYQKVRFPEDKRNFCDACMYDYAYFIAFLIFWYDYARLIRILLLLKDASEKSEAKVEKKMPTAFSNFFKKNNQSNSKGTEPEVKKLQKETPKKKTKKQEGMFYFLYSSKFLESRWSRLV